MLETKPLPKAISMFPGLTDRVYFQNPETQEFWFHATSVCNTLGYSNVTSALALHCDEDEKFQEIYNGKATWFVSEAGCYGLAMGAKNEIAKEFKRWLKHDVLPKLRASGGYIMPTATSEQLKALKAQVETQSKELALKEKTEELRRQVLNALHNNGLSTVTDFDSYCASIMRSLPWVGFDLLDKFHKEVTKVPPRKKTKFLQDWRSNFYRKSA